MNYNSFANNAPKRQFALFMLLMLSTASALANCHSEHTQRMNFTLPDITVSSSTGPGSILAQKTLDVDKENVEKPFICSGGGRIKAMTFVREKNAQGVYATNVKGIGYRLFIDEHPFPWQAPLNCQGANCHLPWPVEPKITLQLVQTLPIVEMGDVLHPGLYGWLRPDSGKPVVLITLTHPVNLHQESCRIQNTHVDFGEVHVKRDTPPGTVISMQPFSLLYQCPFEGTIITRWEGISAGKGYLSSPQLKEKGIEIGIKDYKGRPIYLNKPFKTAFLDNKLKFIAELISTGNVGVGEFDTTATFHIIYP
ncbi:fimbrial protein [Klebsiella grimontii]|uniref:fimbrial protein n=1 Tax=Klebsiella grimontii TaxID=2058152 RepID=UPI001CCE257B|nr:hypothetical protein [Klebsiella grimontii]MBZ7671269.1 hypothetical protein [Klebsiella grimontii]